MEMQSMKLTPNEQSEEMGSAMVDKPSYPYGLEIRLSNDAIEKLGLPALPAVGETMVVMARVKVTSVSQYENEGSHKERSICLQITDMALGADQSAKAPAEKTLYGG
jgi:hypothetical protein